MHLFIIHLHFLASPSVASLFIYSFFCRATMDFSALSPLSSPFNMLMIDIKTVVGYRRDPNGDETCFCDRGRLELDLHKRTFEFFDRRNDKSMSIFHFTSVESGKTRWIKGKDPSKKAAKITLTMNDTLDGVHVPTIIIKMNRLDAIRFNANFLPAYYVAIGRF